MSNPCLLLEFSLLTDLGDYVRSRAVPRKRCSCALCGHMGKEYAFKNVTLICHFLCHCDPTLISYHSQINKSLASYHGLLGSVRSGLVLATVPDLISSHSRPGSLHCSHTGFFLFLLTSQVYSHTGPLLSLWPLPKTLLRSFCGSGPQLIQVSAQFFFPKRCSLAMVWNDHLHLQAHHSSWFLPSFSIFYLFFSNWHCSSYLFVCLLFISLTRMEVLWGLCPIPL